MSFLQEEKLLHLIALLWDALPQHSQQHLEPVAVKLGVGWALPDSEDEDPNWMTTQEVADLFGVTTSSVRTNWPRQYSVRPVNDKWLRRDIELVRVRRELKGKVA